MGSDDPDVRDKAMRAVRDGRGRAARGRAATPPRRRRPRSRASLGLPDRVLDQPLRTLSGGQRRRVELARILFSGAETLLLDEPTNHLDADSIVWLRDFLQGSQGRPGRDQPRRRPARARPSTGCFHLDANRAEIDIYNVGWKAYLQQRETDERRRKRERANAEKKATTLMTQADKMRAKATKATAAQNMAKRAERLLAGLEAERRTDKVAKIALPDAGAVRQDAADGRRSCRSRTARWRSSPTSTWPIDKGSRVVVLGLNGAGKTTLLRILGGLDEPDTGEVEPGHGLKLGYYAQEHETLDLQRTVLENLQAAAPDADRRRRRAACSARSCSPATTPTSRRGCCPAARRPGSRWRPWSSRRPTCCCSTSRRTTSTRPVREEVLGAIRSYAGAIVLVTHDEGAVAGAAAGAGADPARTASRTCGATTTPTWSRSPDARVSARRRSWSEPRPV